MNKKAFTLVELIVVITILAVLATVAFISFQGYAVSSRDSARMADLASMQKVLELYNVKNSKYPTPDSGTNITYSGSTAWTQGVFGTSAYSDGSSMSNVPVDPVTGLEYPYSRTINGKEYSIATILEQPVSSKLTNKTFAGTQETEILVKGNYNGKILKVSANSTTYILGVPSILASDITSIDLVEILDNQRLVYNGYKNLPASFSGSVYDTNPTNGFNFTPAQLILFEGNTQDLVNNQADRVTFLSSLQTNYTGSPIVSETSIAEILAVDSASVTASSNYVAIVLNNSLKTSIPVVASTSSSIFLYPSGCDQIDIIAGGYTIASCNAGTSITGTGIESYGGLYQWGNNYNFRGGQFNDGDIFPKISYDLIGLTTDDSTYSNDSFISNTVPFWSNQNDNIWGYITNTNLAKQGPCESGYYVPSVQEWSNLLGTLGLSYGSNTTVITNILKLPMAGSRYGDARLYNQGTNLYYWSSRGISGVDAFTTTSQGTNIYADMSFSRINANSVRCFKD